MSYKRKMTLPTDSAKRKEYPILSGFLKYFPAAIAGAANTSKLGNDKHNPGEALHHARGKSMDHGDCIVRHLMDTEDLISAHAKADKGASAETILLEVNQMVWRALAYSQELHEQFGAPLAPSAKITEPSKRDSELEDIKEVLRQGIPSDDPSKYGTVWADLRKQNEQFNELRTCTTAECQICNPGASRA